VQTPNEHTIEDHPRSEPVNVPLNYILEADAGHDTNNVAYTYFCLTGNDIDVIERGHGTSPWDPNKIVENPVFGEGSAGRSANPGWLP
jgi:hypothetical protein